MGKFGDSKKSSTWHSANDPNPVSLDCTNLAICLQAYGSWSTSNAAGSPVQHASQQQQDLTSGDFDPSSLVAGAQASVAQASIFPSLEEETAVDDEAEFQTEPTPMEDPYVVDSQQAQATVQENQNSQNGVSDELPSDITAAYMANELRLVRRLLEQQQRSMMSIDTDIGLLLSLVHSQTSVSTNEPASSSSNQEISVPRSIASVNVCIQIMLKAPDGGERSETV